MDTSTNQGLPRTNVRLFLLAATAVLFGLLWSSDQEYQNRELAAARGRERLSTEQPLVAVSPVMRSENAASVSMAPVAAVSLAPVRVAPFAASSWIAPSFATSTAEDAIREPLVAPRVEARLPAPSVSHEPIVSVMVVFRRQSFRVDVWGIGDPGGRTDGTSGWSLFEANYQAIVGCVELVRFEMAGETCEMRWQVRRMANSAGRKLLALVRRQIGPEMDWRILVERIARGGFVPFDSADGNAAAKHAAAPGPADAR
jgi:hypothetical protein